ncbi:hypothetical protein [Ornithinibacillus sp. 179-J 7C1 HS]|uniref:hypothetical protein n=1 Tax=Ornithinibacillus sp. 179-J 7C1 HS TaxID=3142384 RepID=UPI0039A16157
MRKIFVLFIGIALLSGCNLESSLTYSELSKQSIHQDIQSFFDRVKQENGVHLYYDNQNEAVYVYLNGFNVTQGEEAIHFTGFDVERDHDILNILYKSEETAERNNSSLAYELFYKVDVDQDYEYIKLFHNGIESTFDTISGS